MTVMAMTLTEAKAYLMDRRRAPLSDIALHFDSSPEAARQLLQHWVGKGRVRLIQCEACKAGCACASRPDDVYEWVA
ncbi:hypothetical protein CKO16_17315 [Rhodoblastus acidophilus]|nr:hypothetical protein CKO16_17315 [Rhodoblastus acidophilus]